MRFVAEVLSLAHVIAGFIGLAAFWIPVFAKKGAVNHVRFGRVFVNAAYVVLAAAAIGLLLRLSRILQKDLSGDELGAQLAPVVFLGYLTLVTFVIVRHGMRVLKHKRDPAALRTPIDRSLAWLSIAASVGLIVFAVIFDPQIKILLFALSPIGFGSGFGNLAYINGKRADSPRAWLYEHLGAMLGAGIAFHTAFAVFGSAQLFDINMTGLVAVIPWVLPAAVGIPATFIWTRHYRRKFGELA